MCADLSQGCSSQDKEHPQHHPHPPVPCSVGPQRVNDKTQSTPRKSHATDGIKPGALPWQASHVKGKGKGKVGAHPWLERGHQVVTWCPARALGYSAAFGNLLKLEQRQDRFEVCWEMGDEESQVLACPKVRENSPVPRQTAHPYGKSPQQWGGSSCCCQCLLGLSRLPLTPCLPSQIL